MHLAVDGARLFYEQPGDGPDVVLLHPTPVDHGFWLPLAPSLTSRYRVLLPDLRGHGQSQAGEGAITVGRLAADTLRMMDEAGIGRAVLIGCSIGSYTLYELWRRAPERIAGLAFCCGKPQADTAEVRARRQEWIAEIEERGPQPFFDRMLDSLVGKPSLRRAPQIARELRGMMERMRPEAVIATQRGLMERPDSLATAKTITVPAAVLAGSLDGSSTPEEMKQLADAIPGAAFYLLNEMGHYAPYEQPEAVGALLRRFCDLVCP
jgi:3-oxoadipate enol-lactonase